MKLLRHRNDLWLALGFVLLTLASSVFGFIWGFAPAITIIGGLGWDSEIEIIRAQFPSYLVDPAPLADTAGNVMMDWLPLEIYARLAVVIGSWLLLAFMLWLMDRRSRKTEVRRITTWTPR